jgi:hypothetical protein
MTISTAPYAAYGFAFGDGTSQWLFGGAGQGVQVLQVDGLESFPELRTQDNSRGYMDGAFSGRDFLNSRTITMTLQIMGDGASPTSSFQTYLAELRQYLLPQRSGTGVLQFNIPGRGVQRVNARVRRRQITLDPLYTYGRATAMVEFFCPDPRIYSDTLSSYTLSSASTSFRSYPRTYNLVYTGGSGSTGALTVTNQGNYETWPTFTIGALSGGSVCSAPTITNLTTQQVISFPSLSMSATDVLVVDSDLRTVLLNGVAARNALSTSSRWFSLPVGTPQSLQFTVGSGTQTLTLTYRDAYI